MKRTQRHHLKDNELQRLAIHARETFGERKRETTMAIAAAIAIAAVGLGYFGWREHVQSRAHAMLAEAMAIQDARVNAPGTPAGPGTYPNERARLQAAIGKFKAAADAYPSTDSGIFARYQEAAGQLALGNATAATAAFQQVIQRSGNGIYGQMAHLGLAESQARAGQYDQAISTFVDLSQRKDGPLPVDGILMELGRTYREAGKRAEAQQTFNRLMSEYPESPFTADAKRELDALNKS